MRIQDRLTGDIYEGPTGSKINETQFEILDDNPDYREAGQLTGVPRGGSVDLAAQRDLFGGQSATNISAPGKPSTPEPLVSTKGTIASGELTPWLANALGNLPGTVWDIAKQGAGSGIGAAVGGTAGMLLAGPPGAYGGSIAGAGVGQGIQDYLTKGSTSAMSVGGSMAVDAILGPLTKGGTIAATGLLRRTPIVQPLLDKAAGLIGGSFPADLKTAAQASGQDLRLPQTLVETLSQQNLPGPLDPGTRTARQGILDNLQNILNGSPAGTSPPIINTTPRSMQPAEAESIRSLIGKLQDVPRATRSDLADPLYTAVMNDLRDQAAQGNVAAQRLINSGIEINSLKALSGGAAKLPFINASMGYGGMGMGLGLANLLRGGSKLSSLGIGMIPPAAHAGIGLGKIGIENFSPLLASGAVGTARGGFDAYRQAQLLRQQQLQQGMNPYEE